MIEEKVYEFVPPEGSCHQYFIKADSEENAIEKFLVWQDANFKKGSRWPKKEVRNDENWRLAYTCNIIE